MNFIFDSPQGVYQLAAEHDAKNQVLVNNFGDTGKAPILANKNFR
jgi:hypothetical protein